MSTVVNEKEIQKEEKAETITSAVKPTEFLQEVKEEFLKITWPSREQVTREFVAVMLLVGVLTGIIFIFDKVIGYISNFFIGRL